MYANFITESMEKAISETNRRRSIQKEYNTKHHITPTSIKKEVSLGLRAIIPEKQVENKLDIKKIPKDELPGLIKQLSSEMQLAAANLEFEKAALLRDEIQKIKAFML
jgi:excinuclease ABC subunit B